MRILAAVCAAAVVAGSAGPGAAAEMKAGGVRMIPVTTPSGTFKVWTKTVGRNPRIRVLLLHGGPAATHEYFEAFDSFLPQEGIEYIYYDQLGSAYSDQPDEPALWQVPRFVDEVEQVRAALGLGKDDFFLLGHSWGGILAIEYALAYPQHLKGLVISNMMASIPAYNDYARRVLMPAMDPAALKEIQRLEAEKKTDDPRYMALLMPHHYEKHILRRPAGEWPEPVNRSFEHLNPKIYVPMQGPSELGASGLLERWDRTKDLAKIKAPTLVIGAAHDTMDPAHMEWMAQQLPNGRHLHLPNGSHMAMYDDQEAYFAGLVRFLRDVDGGSGAAAAADGLAEMLDRVDAAQVAMHRGRPEAFRALWSQTDDVTLAGGFGGPLIKGWTEVGRRLDWVVKTLATGAHTHERIAWGASGDLGYVVQLERLRFTPPGQADEVATDLRVTMVFRRENGAWRILHRHGDPNLTRALPR